MFGTRTRLVALFVLASLSMGLAACNTIEGIGRDIKAGGDALSNTASSTKKKM